MARVNYRKNEIQLKIVYFGPGRSGKTTCLEYIRKKLDSRGDAELLRLKTSQGRTLFFDFYPMKIGRVRGFDIRVQLYSVPGQVRLEPLRKLVLRGVDSIVFVADAMRLRRQHNVESFENLIETLALYNKKLLNVPFIIQLNKIDLAEEQVPVISAQNLKADFAGCNGAAHLIDKAPVYETNAISGENILKTLESIIKLTVKGLDFDSITKQQKAWHNDVN